MAQLVPSDEVECTTFSSNLTISYMHNPLLLSHLHVQENLTPSNSIERLKFAHPHLQTMRVTHNIVYMRKCLKLMVTATDY